MPGAEEAEEEEEAMTAERICRVRGNKTIPCDGEYVPSEGACFRHACLFDIWIADYRGHRVYDFKGSTIGEENPEKLRRWKRAQFHKWLDTLTVEIVERLLKGKPEEEEEMSEKELKADIEFLADRIAGEGRHDIGASSRSLIGIAYGVVSLDKQEMPLDNDDLGRCERAWIRLPKHRQTEDAKEAFCRAQRVVVLGRG